MKILFCSYEAAPFFKRGGLGDVAGSLPLSLAKIGIETTLILPGYEFLKLPQKPVSLGTFVINFNHQQGKVGLFKLHVSDRVNLYLLYHDLLKNLGQDEKEKIVVFTFFAKAIATLLSLNKKEFDQFDLVHLNDWHTAAVSYFVSFFDKAHQIPTILTIHNLLYQGKIPKERLASLIGRKVEDTHYEGLLELGIKYTDFITTVSPTYAKEIIRTRRGFNLRRLLFEKRDKMTGIINGIDTKRWNPATDTFISNKFDLTNFAKVKVENKLKMQKELKLKVGISEILVSFIGRLEPHQKGIDLILKMLEETVKEHSFQLVILGTGYYTWAKRIGRFVNEHPKNISFINKFDEKLSHKIYAASDIILIPSKFEPCGLIQMIAMRYGTLPLVRKTGGLADTVKDGKNGFVFESYSPTELARTLRMVLKIFREDPSKIQQMRIAAMKEDFSWDKSAREYKKLYQKVIREKSAS